MVVLRRKFGVKTKFKATKNSQEFLAKIWNSKEFFSFLSGKGDAFLAVATPSPLTTPNPLKKPSNGWLTPRILIGVPRLRGL